MSARALIPALSHEWEKGEECSTNSISLAHLWERAQG